VATGGDARPDTAKLQTGRPADIIQDNVSIANDYRMELRKQLLTIATAIFAFTVSLFPQHGVIAPEQAPPTLAWGGWGFLLVSIICGLYSLSRWERFYMSYRDFDNKGNESDGKRLRERLTSARRILDFTQIVALAAGALLVAIFAAFRLGSS
jgi:hypothetical protein